MSGGTVRLALGLAPLAAGPLAGQSLGFGAARWFTNPHVSDYRVGVTRYHLGPVFLVPFGQVAIHRAPSNEAVLVGAGGDLIVPLSPGARPYLVGGVSGGFLDLEKTLGISAWSAWSAGIGTELARLGPLGLAVEARYQRLSREATGGLSLGARVGAALGTGGGGRSRSVTPEPRPPTEQRSGPPEAPRRVPEEQPSPKERPSATPPLATAARSSRAAELVEIARDAMGTPYRWGGTDRNGFDCSGLIQYAYARIGVELPRRGRDQAAAGRQVARRVDELRPGDVLGFGSDPGADQVTHVGLYLGDGRFLHSASDGVRVSFLAEGDPDGRWWYSRWLVARRILD